MTSARRFFLGNFDIITLLGGCSSTVERRVVDPKVAGAAPVFHPHFFAYMRQLLVVLMSLFLGFSLVNSRDVSKSAVSPLAKTPVKISNPTPKATPISTPTLTPSPTPTPNYGFCLYVPVLYYHHIQPQAEAVASNQTSVSTDLGFFDQQMAYLNSHGYTTISALDLVTAIRSHTGVPPKSAVVTLDDGYSDVYTNAFPVIKKYNIHVSLMIPTGLIGNPGFATWGQLSEMKNSGLVYFIDHTWSHYSVQNNISKIHYEIETAKSQIEQYLGQPVSLFAYPYGTFTNLEVEVLKEDNFLGAFSTLPGVYQCESFIMTLHRTRIGNAPLSAYGF